MLPATYVRMYVYVTAITITSSLVYIVVLMLYAQPGGRTNEESAPTSTTHDYP